MMTRQRAVAMQTEDDGEALIFDVQRFSIHDGPGIRTLVFFKGCSLHCAWCHNPESIRPDPEMAFYAERCIGCGGCASVCPHQAVELGDRPRIDPERCRLCGTCAQACPGEALRLIGATWSCGRLLDICLKDRPFYDTSGGGVTLSGGEPVLQAKFLEGFLPLLREQGIHILVETAGHYPFATLAPLLPLIDEIYFDFKLADEEGFRTYTGGNLGRVVENLVSLQKSGMPLTVRVPIVPGINTGADSIRPMSRILKESGISQVVLLAYNHWWEAKLPRLRTGRQPLRMPPQRIDPAEVGRLFSTCGIQARVPEGSPVSHTEGGG
ncbi:MAG: glycyl-radical enzyme activating protein [Desulfobacteraceae bacterium]|nr:MAG: glycyl-radical enzyme activating protein [Desulfobacteraceae bacterium]